MAAHTHACTRTCAHTRTHHACTRSFGSVTQMHRWTHLPSRTLGCSCPCVPDTHLPTQSPAHAWEHSRRGQVPRSDLPLVSGGTELGSSRPHPFTSTTTLCAGPAGLRPAPSSFTDEDAEAQNRDLSGLLSGALPPPPDHPSPTQRFKGALDTRKLGQNSGGRLGPPPQAPQAMPPPPESRGLGGLADGRAGPPPSRGQAGGGPFRSPREQ